jgi:hypothetical protein
MRIEANPMIGAFNAIAELIISDVGAIMMIIAICLAALNVALGGRLTILVSTVVQCVAFYGSAWIIAKLTGVGVPPPVRAAQTAGFPWWPAATLATVVFGGYAAVRFMDRGRNSEAEGGIAEAPAQSSQPPAVPSFDYGVALHSDREEVRDAARRIRTAYDEMRKLRPLGRRAQRLLNRLDEDVGAWLAELPPKKLFPELTDNMKASLEANAKAAEDLLAQLIAEKVQNSDIGAKVNRDRHEGGEIL